MVELVVGQVNGLEISAAKKGEQDGAWRRDGRDAQPFSCHCWVCSSDFCVRGASRLPLLPGHYSAVPIPVQAAPGSGRKAHSWGGSEPLSLGSNVQLPIPETASAPHLI